MKKIFFSENPAELHLLKGKLEEGGIEVSIENENIAPLLGSVPANTETLPTIVLIHDEDYEKAQSILKEYMERGGTRLISIKETRCPLCQMEDIGYSTNTTLAGAVVILFAILLVFCIVNLIRGTEVVGMILLMAFSVICIFLGGLWFQYEINTDKKRYRCNECGFKWNVRRAETDESP
ncbi:MAG: putative signal transducing protein [Planctomycetota bacterium]|jgi:hypothetical protein